MVTRADWRVYGRPRKFYSGQREKLILAAQFEAWLNTPRERIDKKGKVTVEKSRRENFNGAPYCGGYPEVGNFQYLWEYFAEIGAGKQTNGAYVPLEWVDLASWIAVTGIKLDRWEARTLMEMSAAFVEYTYKAKSVSCMLPKALLYLILPEDELAQLDYL